MATNYNRNGALSSFIALIVLVLLVCVGIVAIRRSEQSKSMVVAVAQAFGLAVDNDAPSRGWKFLARGSWDGVALALGIRSRFHQTMQGRQKGLEMVELAAVCRTDLGVFEIIRGAVDDSSPAAAYRLRTGHGEFDTAFALMRPANDGVREPISPFDTPSTTANVPWLDEALRGELLATSSLRSVTVSNCEVTVIANLPSSADMDRMIDIALKLAQWPLAANTASTYR